MKKNYMVDCTGAYDVGTYMFGNELSCYWYLMLTILVYDKLSCNFLVNGLHIDLL
jgi:hypothetical protein